jgi:hypothetical protein
MSGQCEGCGGLGEYTGLSGMVPCDVAGCAAARTSKAAAIVDALLLFITQHRWAMHHSGRSPDHEPYVVEARAELVRLIAEVL